MDIGKRRPLSTKHNPSHEISSPTVHDDDNANGYTGTLQ